MNKFRIKLSSPVIEDSDIEFLSDYARNINSSDLKDKVFQFEKKLSELNNLSYAVVVSSGTAALHLALLALKIRAGDKIIVPTLTFAATAFPIKYIEADPIFIDVDNDSWVINLDLVEEYLSNCNILNLPKAIIAVDLFGRTCDYQRLSVLSKKYAIPIIIDAAESLGSLYQNKPSVTQGLISVVSFNSNKIITTTGGGALLTNDRELAEYCRKLANQSRENVHWFEHNEIGYNYRLSPILAALGTSQIERIKSIVFERQRIRQRYCDNLSNFSGISIIGDSPWESSNAWLTNVRFCEDLFPEGREIVRKGLEINGIESRYVWKPLHLQPIFSDSITMLNGNSEKIYNQSLCLPSGGSLTLSQVDKICDHILSFLGLL
jgi:dTDP-4-amino-4,6-dideoxygalactose transaminase